jgi:predicted dienelactone hydrolase
MTRLIFILSLATAPLFAKASGNYDPLKVPATAIKSKLFQSKDETRGRNLPLRVYLPNQSTPAPVILFSHGLGGSCDNNPYLGNHWAGRGYVVVFVQHPGSDEQVWKNKAPLQRMGAMKNAASLENFLARGGDIPAVIDSLTVWNSQTGHALNGRMNLEKIGMSGHSFGANTTQAVSGQVFAKGGISFLEPRIDASVMMSPGPPERGDPAVAFSKIRIPCLLMTGTLDDSPIGNQTAAERLNVFPHLQKAPAWQVVFEGATHMAFGDRELMGQPHKEPRYHRAILALSTAFWDAHLKAQTPAKAWLNGEGAKSVLVKQDQWQMNRKAGKDQP